MFPKVIVKYFPAALLIICLNLPASGQNDRLTDKTETLRESLVRIEVATYSYSAYYPWRHTDLSQRIGYGCAVGPYQILTTAHVVADAAFVKVQKFGQNETIPAHVKVVDYQCNLAILDLDPDAVATPLAPVTFSEDYQQGWEVDFYWLKQNGRIYSGRGYTDRVEVRRSPQSYGRFLTYIIGNVSEGAGLGQLFCLDGNPVGLGCWYSEDNKQNGVIPAGVINQFLADAEQSDYQGFPVVGFASEPLIDPALRDFLQMPADITDGIYISDVFTLGTGCEALKPNDVIHH